VDNILTISSQITTIENRKYQTGSKEIAEVFQVYVFHGGSPVL